MIRFVVKEKKERERETEKLTDILTENKNEAMCNTNNFKTSYQFFI